MEDYSLGAQIARYIIGLLFLVLGAILFSQFGPEPIATWTYEVVRGMIRFLAAVLGLAFLFSGLYLWGKALWPRKHN